MKHRTSPLVSTSWLQSNLGSPDLRILDASWYLPDAGRHPLNEYLNGHIPGARFFDLESFSDEGNELPHMVPTAESFASGISELGISNEHRVVVYDGAGLFSAARTWWLFYLFGKTDVSILDGGLLKWLKEGRPTALEIPNFDKGSFVIEKDNRILCDLNEVKLASELGLAQIIDARSPKRFHGLEAEPRPNLRSGHIPNSKNIWYEELLNSDKTFKELPIIRELFEINGIDLSKPVITTCGTGVTAAILFLALEMLKVRKVSLYDGSWSEWGMREELDLETD